MVSVVMMMLVRRPHPRMNVNTLIMWQALPLGMVVVWALVHTWRMPICPQRNAETWKSFIKVRVDVHAVKL